MRPSSLARVARGVSRLVLIAAVASPASASDDGRQEERPQTLTREGDLVSLRANPLGGEVIKVDGRLDEAIYSRFEPASDFIQQEPSEGEPATERTEAWIFFDEKNIYVSARCLDSQPDRMVANEMRRDHFNLFENEHFAIVFDTFHDKRNAYMFYTTPLGGLFDGLITDEGATNRDWNTVWDAKAVRDDRGWTVEFVIPFKSLRYGPEGPWGINLRRRVRWKNEFSFLASIPASFGRRGLNYISRAGTLTDLTTPSSARAFEVKPYTSGGLRTDNTLPEPNERTAEFGGDAKLTLSSALALDLTYNTDFAQVEDDLQQVNLSRFNVFFPEKRDFFLEGKGLFELGTLPNGRGGQPPPRETPIVFFSRRIGLAEDGLVPIKVGGRLTAKASGWNVGALQLRAGNDPTTKAEHTDFSVLRVKKDFLKRSTMGVIATRRDEANANQANLVYGGDLNLGFGSTVRITGMGARSDSGLASTGDLFYSGRFAWNTDRYGLEAEHLRVEENFDPGVGFVPRSNIDRNKVLARFSPRPRRESLRAVRKFQWLFAFDRIASATTGNFESREFEAQLVTEFQSGDFLYFQIKDSEETVTEEFELAGGELLVPIGSYRFREYEVRYRLGQQRRVAGRLVLHRSGFYGGTRTGVEYNRGKVEMTSRLSVEPQIRINRLDTPFGKVTTKLITARVNLTLSPRMSLSALTQYNSTSDQLATNVRFRWEYQPGSDIFVVYGDARDTLSDSRLPTLSTRNFVVKFTKLLRF